jgi:uncharacterized protein
VKALIVLLAVLAGVWLWRNGRQKNLAARKRPAEQPGTPQTRVQEMVRCQVCGVHLPWADAVPGQHGLLYCSAEHRRKAEG